MGEIRSKSGLAIALSKLKGFVDPKVNKEQYMTDSEVAATMLWEAFMLGDIESESKIADFGSGTGILGIGALIIGAKQVYFIDSDEKALIIAKENWQNVKSEYKVCGKAIFLLSDIKEFDQKVDLVIQNPPFGVKVRHADKKFVEKAFSCAPVVWTLHMSESKSFIKRFADDKGYSVSREIDFDFPLKSTMKFHSKRIQRIKVTFLRLVRREQLNI